MARTWHRWVPAVAVPAVVAAAVIGGTVATASADLPDRSANDVLELAAASDVQAFSGEVEQSSDLGLPDISALGGASGGSGSGSSSSADSTDAFAADALELLSGSHTARVYVGGPGQLRVQVLDRLAERDVIVNGGDLWLYDSNDSSAVHATLPEHDGDASGTAPAVPEQNYSPSELAQRFIDAVDPSTDVSLGADTEVAGRDAYDLVLTPRSDETLVGSVSIAVDAETGLPLEVEVNAKGQSDPAFSVGFTSISLDTPSEALFEFTPPEGTDVTEKTLDRPASAEGDQAGSDEARADHPEPTVVGEGWGSIVAVELGTDSAEITADPLFAQLTTKVDAGSVLETSLVSILITDDGRVLVGAVPASALEAAAAAE